MDRKMLWLLGIAAAYILLTKSGSAAAPGASTGTSIPPPSGPSLLTAGMSYDPLTGGYCYPANYSGTYIGPYPSC